MCNKTLLTSVLNLCKQSGNANFLCYYHELRDSDISVCTKNSMNTDKNYHYITVTQFYLASKKISNNVQKSPDMHLCVRMMGQEICFFEKLCVSTEEMILRFDIIFPNNYSL